MRQLIVQVPRGSGRRALAIARRCGGTNLWRLEGDACPAPAGPAAPAERAASVGERPVDLVLIHVSNGVVEPLVGALQEIPEMHFTLLPQEVIALRPPAEEAPEQVTDVDARSPLEVYLAGLQSIGGWTGFLGLAFAAGVVAWIGMFTSTFYLLTAAMLIAPFAGPAMNAALATARGDAQLLGRSLLRYAAGLGVGVGTGALMSWLLQQRIATEFMVAVAELSSVALLIPLVAGAAGALGLVQSERSSLVSGAAIGLLVSVSLAPPAALVGMALVLGRWDMVASGAFVLLLTVLAINLAGSLVFRAYGVRARGVRFARGRDAVFVGALAVTLVALGGMMAWQFSGPPDYQRSTRAQRASHEVQRVVEDSGLARVVETNVRFTRADIGGQNSLLAVVYVQPADGVDLSAAAIRRQLTERIQARLRQAGFRVTPLVDVTVLQPPAGG